MLQNHLVPEMPSGQRPPREGVSDVRRTRAESAVTETF